MNLKELDEIISLFSKNNLTHLEVSEGETQICIKKEYSISASLPTPISTTEITDVTKDITTNGTSVKAPMVGIFYTSQSPESAPFVTVGSKVEKGEVIGLIEAMKMMNEIIAPTSGIIQSIFVQNEELVSYDDSLFIIEDGAYVS
ncbi:MAG: biotin/lipoyl-containing protein [Eubacteriales bacterium]